MADIRVGVQRWDSDHETELGERGNAEFGAWWLAIDGRVVLDCDRGDPLMGVSYETDGNGFSTVTIQLFAGSFASVDKRRRPLSQRLRRGWRRQRSSVRP